MSSIITFAANNDLFRKRKRVFRACESCKKRRKRCTHVFDEPDAVSANEPQVKLPRKAPSSPQAQGQGGIVVKSQVKSTGNLFKASVLNGDGHETPSGSQKRSKSPVPPRFYGYLHPETELRHQIRDQSRNPQVLRHQCGYWIQTEDGSEMPAAGLPRESLALSDLSNSAQEALSKYLHAVDFGICPPRQHQDAMLEIFFSFVHPLLPVVEKDVFLKQYAERSEPRLLLQVLCIIASKHDQARKHLYLGQSTELLSPRDFAQRLYKSVCAALDARQEPNRIVLIQINALLSMYSEGYDGFEQASFHLVTAIHHAHTIGLQFGRARQSHHDEYLDNLWWCLWSLDRVTAFTCGRPLSINDRDNRLDKITTQEDRKYTPFGIWLQLCENVDTVINYYRPTNEPLTNNGWESNFPAFEDFLGGDERVVQIDPTLLAALELFYYAVAMTTYTSRSLNDPERGSPAYLRQSHSADKVRCILGSRSHENLPPVSIIPYALSVATSVSYRHYRQAQIQRKKEEALQELTTCCVLLRRMRYQWWSAAAMAELASAALAKADRQAEAARQPSVDEQQKNEPESRLHALAALAHAQPVDSDPMNRPYTSSSAAGGSKIPSTITSSFPNFSATPTMSPLTPQLGTATMDLTDSLDWLNFDNCFDNMDTLLGSSGADMSMEMLRPFDDGGLGLLEFPQQ
ncbi:hypothetical protein P152DRAFT_336219 [Eremomyces bilateralis CBS 781.70]|uniref:Xylanolytic transcriptional activator regulatory domain-containing protein n=1 Tax=Eremomyces bilateralis CBS 781.70 TaxID=1392243 RepID=A0A6G1G530_9PEZI|nr:uncharacterized protein P152DRAFT_336219 [Eremomyces bilateralis CBS 781.70]KAF1813036.1 hypothetical protein P152DRAFT_336219 [Eremomyces bilateralis CBS 781.70]